MGTFDGIARKVPMHTRLAVTSKRLLLHLTAAKVFQRMTFKDANAPKRRMNPTRVLIGQKENIR